MGPSLSSQRAIHVPYYHEEWICPSLPEGGEDAGQKAHASRVHEGFCGSHPMGAASGGNDGRYGFDHD